MERKFEGEEKSLSENGFSITLVFGPYGGFYVYTSKHSWRLCLGWMALSILFYDVENSVTNHINELKSQRAIK